MKRRSFFKIISNTISLFSIAVLFTFNLVYSQDQQWKMHVIDDFFSGADGVRIKDVNGDGLMDFTTGWEEAGITIVYIHPGYENVKEK